MFFTNIKSLIMLNIYLLVIANIGLLAAIYYQVIKSKVKAKQYEKALTCLRPKVLDYIEDEENLLELQKSLKSDFSKNVAIDIMVDYCEENNVDINPKFTKLNFDTFLTKKLQKSFSIVHLRKLAFMRVSSAYDLIIRNTESEDLDISYMSFFALALMNLPREKKEIALKKLIVSDILSDRIIEIMSRYDLKFEEWIHLLEKEESTAGKVMLIKNLIPKEELKIEKKSDRLKKFLNDTKEVKISAIQALCSSRNEKYVDELINIYENEETWEVRVTVAKGLSNFRMGLVQDVLLRMTKDEEWWVRYNAVKSIVSMGEEGLFTLIDLSLGKEDEKVSDLAYYFLNSNKDVYNVVMNLEV